MQKNTRLVIKQLGLSDYVSVYQQMQRFTQSRADKDPDELWLVEHPPVYTQGLAGKPEHLLNPGQIPVVQTDRGGQVTYHGPGQLVAYTLFDLNRLKINVRELVSGIEQSIIWVCNAYGIAATSKQEAPGVYVEQAKIASIGLRVKKAYCYHGLALNVAMDLSPFEGINPCGYSRLKMTQLNDYIAQISVAEVAEKLVSALQCQFGYEQLVYVAESQWPAIT